MDDDLLLIGALDQSLPTNGNEILKKIDDIVYRSIDEQDPSIALSICAQLLNIGKISGLGLARGLYLIKTNWDKYNIDATFEEVVYPQIGLHPHTIVRYLRIWEMLEHDVPKEMVDDMRQKNIKELVPIANAVAQGYEISEGDWNTLADAPDLSTILSEIRDIKVSRRAKVHCKYLCQAMGNSLR